MPEAVCVRVRLWVCERELDCVPDCDRVIVREAVIVSDALRLCVCVWLAVRLPEPLPVGVTERVNVCVLVAVSEKLGEEVSEPLDEGVSVSEGDPEGDPLSLGDAEGVPERLCVGVSCAAASEKRDNKIRRRRRSPTLAGAISTRRGCEPGS